ncbi:unnamed protein product (macronuclear) [Paramecium tetraurelia]|uniref:Kinesin motor domain-containing protein n=1 Tax=Paramecium tetraurelia TaxID=5888 RepID=A0CC70_PARTE|nr:uncharacterized protein GSPATT00037171001 [Paramecium tetraurelia]CAK68387.1 unnamed protein product [Paramecium tetraurelia]|eukprot:XP_001435784.1 hypothetical protein (macronuclear) [Paramecium tetraurelia strain d4-2]
MNYDVKFCQVVKDQQLQFNNQIQEQDQWFITYGECASGKTTAMFREDGVIQQIGQIYIDNQKQQDVSLSMIEIRETKLIDLFTQQEVKLITSNQSFNCLNLKKVPIQNMDQYLQIIKSGYKNRTQGDCMLNNISTRYPMIVKLDFGNFAIQFVDLVGSQKAIYCSPKAIKEITFNNKALGQIQSILNTNDEAQRLLLCNTHLVTKVLKNAFRNTSLTNLIVCVSAANIFEKDTLKILKQIKGL